MKRLIVLGILVVIMVNLLLLGVADTRASIADTTIPDNQITSSVSEIDDSNSTSAIITITMYAVADILTGD